MTTEIEKDYCCKLLEPFGMLVGPKQSSRAAPIDCRALYNLLLENRLLVLRGFDAFPNKPAMIEYAKHWGPLLEWDFGTVLEVVEHDSPQNYLFTNGSVPYHYDGAFAAQTPWLQIFQCLEAPGSGAGGETLFCDTTRVLSSADELLRSSWSKVEIEYATQKVAHYGGRVQAALVQTHPLTGEAVLRYNEPANADTANLNTPQIIPLGMAAEEATAFIADITKRVYDPATVYAHTWEKGDLVIADNFSLLHGRRPFRSKQSRRLWRIHVLANEKTSKCPP